MPTWHVVTEEDRLSWQLPEDWPVDPFLGVKVATISKYESYVSRRAKNTVRLVWNLKPPYRQFYSKRGGIRVRCSACNWSGYRRGLQCECYEDWSMYCRPWSPGPGCPSGILWPCPQCSGHGHDWIKS